MKKIKLDENFPPSSAEIFRKKKIDASSVYEQRMNGSDDDEIFNVCKKEDRILVTFDLDFANIIRYPSHKTPGIIIARNRRKINLSGINSLCNRLALVIAREEITGKLYIVEPTTIRVRKPDK
jgi:predicted nuclease of predicted toxin-antitoxin system